MVAKSSKKAVNLSIDAELLETARREKVNLSALLERSLRAETARLWLEENRDAIGAYNEEVEANGVWSDGVRRW
jgi:antitoxin CcdA